MKTAILLLIVFLASALSRSSVEKVMDWGAQPIYKFRDGPVTCYILQREYKYHGNDSLSCVVVKQQ